ncbi:MAG TPA: formyltransferase family protein [Ignavibacteriales bacterium]|nr:formyltransferase family protein [Ignavibacteriales bacterium]
MRYNLILLLDKNVGLNIYLHLLSNLNNYNIDIKAIFLKTKSKFNFYFEHISEKYGIKYYNNLDDILNFNDIDFIISVQYDRILKKNHLSIAKKLNINLHMAPLPEYRGCNQFSFAILNEDTEFGTTLHIMDEKIDNGDILAQLRFPIPKGITVEELFYLTELYSLKLFEDNIKKIFDGQIVPIPQSSIKAKTEFHKRDEIKEIKIIDLSSDKKTIEKHILATTHSNFEPPYIIIDGKKYYIIKENHLNKF